jgi:hypothetical protein
MGFYMRMKITKRCLSLLLAGSSILYCAGRTMADDPTTRPNSPPPSPMNLGPMFGQASPQEWDELTQFLDVNSPNRAKMVKNLNLPEGGQLRQMMLRQFRAYKLVREQFPEVADLRLQQFKLEDDVFGLTQQARTMNARTAYERIYPLIEEKERQIADKQMQQEQLRIDRLQKTLDQEVQRLARARSQMDQLVAEASRQAMPPRMRGFQLNGPNGSPTTNPSGDINVSGPGNAGDATKPNPIDPLAAPPTH